MGTTSQLTNNAENCGQLFQLTIMNHITGSLISIFSLLLLIQGCSPRVGIELPDKPITINLNVKIDHEVRVKVEKDLDNVISTDSKLF